MVIFPNCKINLGLRILRKRNDGYHDLETVFYPLRWNDIIEVITQNNPSDESVQFFPTGLSIAGDTADNLCIKAYYNIKKRFPELPAIQLHLHKVIPMGAGLGGGSADGAFTLRLLNEKYQLGLTTKDLTEIALELGSDCSFFIKNSPSYATGRGENLQSLTLDLSSYFIVLINPGIHINTRWAFSQLDLSSPSTHSIIEIISKPVTSWKTALKNDFEVPVFHLHPEIAQIKETLYSIGAEYASMSGSGSTVFGLYKELPVNLHQLFPPNYLIKTLYPRLLS